MIVALGSKTPMPLSSRLDRGMQLGIIFVTNLDVVKRSPPVVHSEWVHFIQPCSMEKRSVSMPLLKGVPNGSVLKLEVLMTKSVANTSTLNLKDQLTGSAECVEENAHADWIVFNSQVQNSLNEFSDLHLGLVVNNLAVNADQLQRKASVSFSQNATGYSHVEIVLDRALTADDIFDLDLVTDPAPSEFLEFGRYTTGGYSCYFGNGMSGSGNMEGDTNWYHRNPLRKIRIQEPLDYKLRLTLLPSFSVVNDHLMNFAPQLDSLQTVSGPLPTPAPDPIRQLYDACTWRGQDNGVEGFWTNSDFGLNKEGKSWPQPPSLTNNK